jgi:hypothetical protein
MYLRTVRLNDAGDRFHRNCPTSEYIRAHLAGKDLACWCTPGDPCHADVLLEIANTDPHTAAAAEVPATTAQTPNPSERN